MNRGSKLALLLLLAVVSRAQEVFPFPAESPAVEVVPNALAANVTAANARAENNVGGAGGGSLLDAETVQNDFAPDRPDPVPVPPDVNTTAAGGGRRRLTSYKKKINAAKRARSALKQAKTVPLEPITTTKTITVRRSGERRALLQKPKTVEPTSVSITNVLKNLKYEEQKGYTPRDSGAKLAIGS